MAIRYGYASPLPGALGPVLWPLVRGWAGWSDRRSSPGRPCSPGGCRKRVAGVAATITRLRSGFRSGERARGLLRLPFPVPTSVHLAQLGQGWELGPRLVGVGMGDPGRQARGLKERPGRAPGTDLNPARRLSPEEPLPVGDRAAQAPLLPSSLDSSSPLSAGAGAGRIALRPWASCWGDCRAPSGALLSKSCPAWKSCRCGS